MDGDNSTVIFVQLSHGSSLFSYHRHRYVVSGHYVTLLFGI